MPDSIFIGVDLGGTKTAVVYGGERGAPLGRRVFQSATSTGARLPEAILGDIVGAAHEFTLEAGSPSSPARIAAIGISSGGPLDEASGLIVAPPNLPAWRNVPIVSMLSSALGAPAFLENDANASALAEWREGAGRGLESLVFITFGTGLGAGIILDGRLWRGACGMAGELGHWRLSEGGPVGYGKEGSFEGWCSGGGIAQAIASRKLARAQGSTPLVPDLGPALEGALDVRGLAAAARSGDAEALALFERAGTMLGRGLALLVDLLNPEAIVIGSIFSRCRDLLWPSAELELGREALPRSLASCRVLGAELGEEVGDRAALWAGRQALEARNPGVSSYPIG